MKWVVILLTLLLVASVSATGDRTIYYPIGGSTTTNIFNWVRLGSSTDYTNFSTTGHQTMVGDARPWRDESTDALNLKNTGTPGVSINPTESTLDFVHTAGLTDYAYFNIQLNHDKDLTANIYPHIHFFAGDTTDMPNFMFQYRWQKTDGTKVTAWTNYKCNTMLLPAPAVGTTNNNIASNTTGITPPTGSFLSDIIQFRLIRYHDGTGIFPGDDQYDGTVSVMSADVHFMIDSLGSTDEIIK